jgi:hypothetical protein
MRILAAALVSLCLAACSFAQSTTTFTGKSTGPAKKLIEFGWDEPDTAFMRQHIAAMEQTPFDGTVFHITYDKADGSKGSFMNQCWGQKTFEMKQVAAAVEDLKATPIKSFTHNFLRFNVCPGDVDWFDDFSSVTANAALAAHVAKEGKSAGILFDIEQYNAQLFNYAKQKLKDSKSFDEYAQQARLRGREIMKSFQDGYPDLTIFLTFGYSLALAEGASDKSKLAGVEYGLLAPFLDGMFDAAAGKTKIVDGFEISYAWKQPAQFDEGLKTMRVGALPIVADAEKYRAHLSAGFGLWMDNDWRKNGWDVNNPDKNFFTPAQFEQSVREALDTSDEFVWIYTEEPKWWTMPDGKPQKLPPPYSEAVRKAAGK